MKSDKKPIKKQCFLKCWLLLATADHDVIRFGCLHDNQRLGNIIQVVLVIILCIYFFTRLQIATEVDATCMLITTRPSSRLAIYLTPSITNHKNFTMDYNRAAYYKAQDKTLNCWNIYFYIIYIT